MAIERIDNFHIAKRHLFSGIYGIGVEDVFIGEDLRIYGLWEALYRSFKAEGYTVIYYSHDDHHNFFSYGKADLAKLYKLSPSNSRTSQSNAAGRYVAKINSPFGNRRKAGTYNTQPSSCTTEDADYAQIQTALSGSYQFYRIADDVDPFTTITNYIEENPQEKMAFIFVTAFTDTFDTKQVKNITSKFSTLKIHFNSRNIQSKIIAVFNCHETGTIFNENEGEFFRNSFFKDALNGAADDSSNGKSSELYKIGSPLIDEFKNLLNRKRILEGLKIFDLPNGFEGTAARLSQDVCSIDYKKQGANSEKETLNHYVKMASLDFLNLVEGFGKDKAIDKLRSMCGLEHVIEQLKHYITLLRDSKSGNLPRFRPHLVFSGNPGTGKTTVARLLAQILREEGLLERGQLIEATVGDLEGEYIGQTRIKTQTLCDRARGGVLFIDEAYGLISGTGHNNNADYGKEAIEVLIQFMENSTDSLVILGGYKAEMEDLIQNGNQGFMRRFNGKDSFIQFDDYTPDALYAIFQRQIKGKATEPEFDIAIKNIIKHQYAHRTARWGNASEMEKMASAILGEHRRNKRDGALATSDIPEYFMRLITPVKSVEQILEDVEALVGLKEVKQNLRDLLMSAMGQRMSEMNNNSFSYEKRNLNFIFTGAPGTGKTTVAHLMAKILYMAGLIDKSDKAVIVQKGDIIKSGVGDTPKAIKQLFMDHAGEVIFIDEAYALTEHGSEAIDEITNCLTDPRFMGNQAVILAGYTNEMNNMLAHNRGMKSRFQNIWFFEDYSNEELWQIFINLVQAKNDHIKDMVKCKALAFSYFDEERKKLGEEFSNARKAKELFQIVDDNYNKRIFNGQEINNTILPDDFPDNKVKV